jgi:hypothetical protein
MHGFDEAPGSECDVRNDREQGLEEGDNKRAKGLYQRREEWMLEKSSRLEEIIDGSYQTSS